MSSDFWYVLAMACCLMLVLEGIVPFLYPQRWRDLMMQLAQLDDRTLRIMALISMLAGVVGLYIIH